MQQCEYFVVRYSSGVSGELRIPIGLVLLTSSGQPVRHALLRDWRTVRCLDPGADLGLLDKMPDYFAQLVAEHESANVKREASDASLRQKLIQLSERGFGSVEIASPRGVETDDPEREFDRLFQQHVEARWSAKALPMPAVGSRRWIQSQLRERLERYELWDRLERKVAVEEYTAPGDAFRIDLRYQPNGIAKYLHCLSLDRDWNQAKVLSYTFSKIREKRRAVLTTIVADQSDDGSMAQGCRKILSESGINIQPLSMLDAFLQRVRTEMSPIV